MVLLGVVKGVEEDGEAGGFEAVLWVVFEELASTGDGGGGVASLSGEAGEVVEVYWLMSGAWVAIYEEFVEADCGAVSVRILEGEGAGLKGDCHGFGCGGLRSSVGLVALVFF